MKKKLALLMAMVMVFGVTVAGTLAWLMDESVEVVNTFTVGDINIDLSETTGDEYHVVPGTAQAKDPKVTIEEDSEKAWIFVQIKEEDTDGLLTYEINDDDWDAVEGVDNVWYRIEDATTNGATSYYVLAGSEENPNGEVSYSEDLEKVRLEASEGATLTFKAFAVQFEAAATAAEAWTKVPANEKLN